MTTMRLTRNDLTGTYAYDPKDIALHATVRPLARKRGVSDWNARLDCWAADGSYRLYEITYLRPVSRKYGGGYNIVGREWVTVSQKDVERVKAALEKKEG